MSPVMSNDPRWNEKWHEELLSISLLGKNPLRREELKKRIRSIQKERSAFFEPHLPNRYHSYSNYNHWLCNLIERGVIEEDDGELRLTSLGKWIARSKLGSLFERNSFLKNFVCKKCSSPSNMVLLTPLLDTIDTNTINVKGQIWVDLRCPNCGAIATHHLGFSKAGLDKFYNQVVAELGDLLS
ncbi:MAG: hypothetical protein J7M30_09090 [Deltaproteobacteria bacterium]|nr:hypothetical protein [Deltaproteobacteria bacterium]